MVAGELVALLLTTALPETLPVVVGAKATANEVAWLGKSVRGRVRPETVKPLPVTLSEVSETLEFPVLVSVTVCVALEPVVTLPKLRAVGDALSCSVLATAVPERGTETSGVVELLERFKLPEYVPAAAGEKLTVHKYEPPGERVNGVASPDKLKAPPVATA